LQDNSSNLWLPIAVSLSPSEVIDANRPRNGSTLFISEGTVKSNVKAIFAKMNVISRTEAVASATRRGLIQL
jgi:Bacterial regulatory proteins, luxR family